MEVTKKISCFKARRQTILLSIVFLYALFLAINVNAIPTNDLVAYWKFNEVSGNALDSSGNNHTLLNPCNSSNLPVTYDLGILGNSAYFNNKSCFNSSNRLTDFNFNLNNFTLAYWIKKPLTLGYPAIITNSLIYPISNNRWLVRENADETKGFMWEVNSVTTSAIAYDGVRWRRVVIKREGTGTNETKIFLDGELIKKGTTNINFNMSNNLLIGMSPDYDLEGSIVNYWLQDIYIDELSVNNGYAWSDVEIANDYLLTSNNSFIEMSQSFNPITYSASLENYKIVMAYNTNMFSSIQASLVYNGTKYISELIETSNVVTFSKNLSMPIISSQQNKSFYWEIGLTNMTGITYLNSSWNNQTINPTQQINYSINNPCATGLTSAFYFDFYDETNLTKKTADTLNYNFRYGLSNNTAYTIYGNLSSVSNFSICINSSEQTYNLGYGEIQYNSAGSTDRRYYLFSGTRLTNQTINTSLYFLDNTLATSFLVTAQTTTIVPYKQHYLTLLRWYSQLNEYKVVEMAKTDDKGQSVLRVKAEDVDYRIGLYNNYGSLIKLINPLRMVCLVSPCSYSIYVSSSQTEFSTWANIQSSLSYNNNTNVFTFIWNDPSQLTQLMNLTIYKDTGISSTIICSTSSAGFTGVLTCDTTGYTGTLRAEAYRTASPTEVIKQLIVNLSTSLKDISGGSFFGLIIGIFIFGFFMLIGLVSPPIAVVFGLIGLIPMMILGNINWAIFTAIAVFGGITLHFLRRTQ